MSLNGKKMNFLIPCPKPVIFVIFLVTSFGIITTVGLFIYEFQNVQAQYSDEGDTNYEDSQYSDEGDTNYEDSQYSDEGDTNYEDSQDGEKPNPIGKAVCSTTLGLAGNAIGDAILPGVGGLLLGGVGSNLC